MRSNKRMSRMREADNRSVVTSMRTNARQAGAPDETKATPNNTRIKSDRDRVWRVMGDSGTVG